MLVYHKEPMGYTSIGSKRIYGKFFNYGRFGPANVTRSTFKKHKNILEEVEYDEKILKKIFGVTFPIVRFRISELWKLDFNKLIEVALLIGIPYIPSRTPTYNERRALRKSVIGRLTD